MEEKELVKIKTNNKIKPFIRDAKINMIQNQNLQEAQKNTHTHTPPKTLLTMVLMHTISHKQLFLWEMLCRELGLNLRFSNYWTKTIIFGQIS